MKQTSTRYRSFRLAALAAGLLFGTAAHAALSATGVSCSGQGTALTGLASFVDCSGAWSGNNSNQFGAVQSQVLADWNLTITGSTDVTGGNAGSSGTLHFANETGLFVVALKAGDAFSLYEFNGASVPGGMSSLNFDTLGVGFFSGGNHPVEHFGQGLSHADVYSVSTVVPEPATPALMLAGLGVLGVVMSRRKTRA